MNILFLGGNRYFGKSILKMIKKNHNKIYVVNRGSKKNIIKHPNIRYLNCNRNQLLAYKDIFKNIIFDKVFDNIAYKLDDVKTLHKLLKNKIKHYIFTSSSITYLNNIKNYEVEEKDWTTGKINQNFKKKHTSFEISYAINKKKIEKYLFKKNLFKSTILRVPSVIGSSDFSKKTSYLLNYDYEKNFSKKFMNDNYLQFVFKDDLVKIILKILNKKTVRTSAYNVANKKIKVYDFYKKIKKINKNFNKTKLKNKSEFPIPLNSIMKNNKIKKKLNFSFSSIDKIISSQV